MTTNPKQLRTHQREAFQAAVRALTHMPRATVVSATGTGKTLTAIRVAEHFASHGNILVVVPSLNLITQTAGHWARDSLIKNMLGVCSLDPPQLPFLRVALPTTTKAPRIAKLIATNTGPTVVFTTYSSLPAITNAHRKYRLPPWAIVIVDEAHRSSGNGNKQWASIHKDSAIPAKRRLYMTATPRTWHPEDPLKARRRRKTASQRPPEPIASMDDPSIYGPVVYQLGLADAIDRGILADYRIVVPVIGDDELRESLQKPDRPHHDGLRLSALQVCLLRAMAMHRVRRVISFHSRIAYAQNFSETLPDTVAAVSHSTGIRHLWTYALHGKQSIRKRATYLTEFENIPLVHRRTRPDGFDGAVLANVRVLGEGVDVPDADAIVFADPKRSSSDIIQSLGRALRQPPGAGKVAVLIIPVYVGRHQTTEEALKSSDFKIVWEVLNGLRTHDAKIWYRMSAGDADGEEDEANAIRPLAPERATEIAPVTGLRVHQADTQIWSRGWIAAIRYFERHEHLNVPSDYTDPTGYPLGLWIGQQRSLYAHGSLAPDRALALSSLNMSWPHPQGSFEDRLEQAVVFAEHHGTLAVAAATNDTDGPMIRWLTRQRALADSGRMHIARVDALKAVDPWWNPTWGVAWQHDFTHVSRQLAAQTAEPTPVSGEAPYTWLDRQLTQQHKLYPQQVTLLAQLTTQHQHSHPHALLLQSATTPRMRAFHRGLRAARQFLHREGHLQVPHKHREDLHGDIVRLGIWINKWRAQTAQLSTPQITALTALGIDVDPVFQAPPADSNDLIEDDMWWAAADALEALHGPLTPR
ncbi:Helicase associated domain protein [Streptomyces sp. NPDC004675]|uniref:DEAD/DEAH box helicase n=1 Tax=Streptomyces sp. NPDC004675 TaxID=3154286 RepID=UPI0033A2BE3C